MTVEIRPDLQSLVNMTIGKLQAISKAVPDTDQLVSMKVAKDAKQARGLLDMIREEINEVRKAHKAALAKKAK